MTLVSISFCQLPIKFYTSFNPELEVRSASLDIAKDISSIRKQRVLLNDKTPSWAKIDVEVPQGFILGLLSFLIYINDLSEDL